MNRKFLLVLILVATAIAAAAVFLSVSGNDGRPAGTPRPTPSATPSPTPDLLSPADRELLIRLSTELATKYRSFDRVDQAYLDSIRPYLTKQFFDDYRGTLRYADRAPFLQPVKSRALETQVTGNSSDGRAAGTVKLDSTDLRTGDHFGQTLRIEWERFDGRWSATDINALEFDKE